MNGKIKTKSMIVAICLFFITAVFVISIYAESLGCGNLSKCKNKEKCVGDGMADGCEITCANGTIINCPKEDPET